MRRLVILLTAIAVLFLSACAGTSRPHHNNGRTTWSSEPAHSTVYETETVYVDTHHHRRHYKRPRHHTRTVYVP